MMQSCTLLNRRTVLGAVKARLGSTSDTQVTANAGLDRPCARRTPDTQAGTWRNRGVTTARTGWPPRNAKGARACPRASSMSASMYH
jgi:hypothetical protein